MWYTTSFPQVSLFAYRFASHHSHDHFYRTVHILLKGPMQIVPLKIKNISTNTDWMVSINFLLIDLFVAFLTNRWAQHIFACFFFFFFFSFWFNCNNWTHWSSDVFIGRIETVMFSCELNLYRMLVKAKRIECSSCVHS